MSSPLVNDLRRVEVLAGLEEEHLEWLAATGQLFRYEPGEPVFHVGDPSDAMFVILEGSGTLRVAGERIAVRQGDVIDIPPGPEYPHQLINTSNAPLKYLSISTQEFPEVCEYPDSGKYLAFTPVAGPLLEKGRMHRPDTDLDYWDGEP